MKLTVPKADLGHMPAMERVEEMFGEMLDAGVPLHTIGCVNWPEEFPDRPEVKFAIAHSGREIYIKFHVTEDAVRAVSDADGGRPWEESCVEFFVSPFAGGGTPANSLSDGTPDGASDGAPGSEPADVYYNLEMNCLGYGILNGGAPGNRTPGDVGKVRRLASMRQAGEEPFGVREGRQSWTLTVAIPVEALGFPGTTGAGGGSPEASGAGGVCGASDGTGSGNVLSGKTMRANFYKCGDKLPRPHYLSWNPIEAPHPSFHRPEQFGTLVFE